MGLFKSFISNLGFGLTMVNCFLTWFAIMNYHTEDKIQAWFNAVSLLFSSASSFWLPASVVNAAWDDNVVLLKTIVGLVLSGWAVRIDAMEYENEGHMWMLVPFCMLECSYLVPVFWENIKTPAFFQFIPKLINLVSVLIPIVGSIIFSNWEFALVDAYNSFLGASCTFCWLADSDGNTLDLVLIYLTAFARLIYGIFILFRCIGAEIIWEWMNNVCFNIGKFFYTVGEAIWEVMKEFGRRFWAVGEAIWEGMKKFGRFCCTVAEEIWEVVKKFGSCCRSVVESIWEAVKKFGICFWAVGKAIWEAAKKFGRCFWVVGEAIWEVIKKFGSCCWAVGKAIWEAIKKFGTIGLVVVFVICVVIAAASLLLLFFSSLPHSASVFAVIF